MRTFLIDDEPAASRTLTTMLQRNHPEVEVTGSATSIAEGLQRVNELKPDLIFLDINLPDGRGFDLVRQLSPGDRPEIVFVTSEAHHALRAIKVAALGYIIKPVAVNELKDAVELARARIHQKNSERRLTALLNNLDETNTSQKQVGIPSERGVEFVNAGDILYCKGVDGYTSIEIGDQGRRLSSYSIGEYRRMLEPLGFFAVHRSYLVNRLHITGWASGGALKLRNGEMIAVSRRRKDAVIKWLQA